jgi:hypothetical protein
VNPLQAGSPTSKPESKRSKNSATLLEKNRSRSRPRNPKRRRRNRAIESRLLGEAQQILEALEPARRLTRRHVSKLLELSKAQVRSAELWSMVKILRLVRAARLAPPTLNPDTTPHHD